MRVLVIGLLGVLSGCGSLGVSLTGTLRSDVLEARASSEERPLHLAFDRLGNLTLNGQVLELPAAREHRRFGVGFVDAGALPPVWRPAHAVDGGVLVAWLHKASPLAVAGVRPFDRVVGLGVGLKDPAGARAQGLALSPTPGVDGLVDRLEEVAELSWVALEVIKPDGRREVLSAQASEAVADSQTIGVPFLFDRHVSATGHAFGFGPLDGLFYYRSLTDQAYVDDPARGHATYVDRFEWGTLFNLLLYESREDVYTGAEGSRLRLFGVDLWNDLDLEG